jgi:hypothetical protein
VPTVEQTVLVTAGWHWSPRWGVEAGIGSILGGSLTTPDGIRHTLGPGPAATVAASWLGLYETPVRPFLMLGGSASMSRATTDRLATLMAVDIRVTAMVGKTFFQAVTPYVVGRVFGGPVYWDQLAPVGTDTHHYAVGAGITVRLPAGVDAFAEGIPLGEKSLSAGAGISF